MLLNTGRFVSVRNVGNDGNASRVEIYCRVLAACDEYNSLQNFPVKSERQIMAKFPNKNNDWKGL